MHCGGFNDRGQETDDRDQKTEDRKQRTAGRGAAGRNRKQILLDEYGFRKNIRKLIARCLPSIEKKGANLLIKGVVK
jgi:hypothetical protein